MYNDTSGGSRRILSTIHAPMVNVDRDVYGSYKSGATSP